jgi:purine-binding chemotaxis protein CheW
MSLVFRAGSLLCALRLDEVIETMRPLAVQPLAGTASFVRGICVMRGTPAPVIDVALLLGGHPAPATRFVAVRTDRGVAAFATGAVLGTRPTVTTTNKQHARLLGVAPARLVAAIGTVDTEPLIQLASLRMVPDHVWASATAEDSPS